MICNSHKISSYHCKFWHKCDSDFAVSCIPLFLHWDRCSCTINALKIYLLTTRPGAERGSCSTQVFFFVFFHFVGDQTQTPSQPNFESCNVWYLFTKSCWNINTWTILLIFFSLLWVKYIFFWFYWSVGFEGNNKYGKKGITSAVECDDIASFTFVTWQIRSCYFASLFR